MSRLAAGIAAVLGVGFAVQAQMALPGSFEVSETGAAVYTIPIAVPPGTAGLEPKLTLQYSSRAGNGLLGVGWTLGGLPSIVRCPKTIAQDGARGGINYDSNDRFCLEGERLTAITGTYGAGGTEYRTEREGFSKIISYGSAGTGPAWFKVWTKAGQILEFGNTADSRIEAQGKSTARLWAVNKVSDTAGNYFTVTYAEDNANGEYRPTRIDYTGNAAASVAPYASARFVYETRPAADITPLYEVGSWIKTTQHLTKIQAYVGESIVREYRLGYDQSPATSRSRVISVAVCEASGACLPASTFTPNATVYGWNVSNPSITFHSGATFLTGDFNGDGLTDVAQVNSSWTTIPVCFSTGTAWSCRNDTATYVAGTGSGNSGSGIYSGATFYTGDFNGDGLTDIAQFNSSWTSIPVCYSTGTGWSCRNQHATYMGGTGGGLAGPGGAGVWPNPTVLVGDVNGDGRADIIQANSAWTNIPICFSTGEGWECHNEWTYFAGGTGGGTAGNNGSGVWPGATFLTGDVNGDGRTDIIQANSAWTNIAICFSTGTGWSCRNEWTYFVGGTGGGTAGPYGAGVWPNATFLTGDVNGDGKTDIIQVNSVWTNIPICLSTGEGWRCRNEYTYYAGSSTGGGPGNNGSAVYPEANFMVADVNGDGRADIVQARWMWTHMPVCFATAEGWSCRNEYATPYQGTSMFIPGDFNGDGRADILQLNSGWSTMPVVSVAGPMVDLTASVTSGVGSVTAVTHDQLAKGGSLYTKDTGSFACPYPCIDVQGPIYVVSEVQSANGIGGNYRTTYRYAGAKADQSGRGFLGFRQVIAKDEQTLVEQATEYLQSWPFVGLTVKRTKTLGAVELNRTENTYAADDLGSGRRFVKLAQSVESSKELNGTALPTVTTAYQYDTYGNATQVAVSTGDGHSKTTVNTYTNDLTNWLLGRLTRAEVTSVTP